ncbi:LpqB family beta-propeller domain-containing protein [Gordonia araii]|nr:LpqB family beta-propeller domain-containing protein [Gordonia araii]
MTRVARPRRRAAMMAVLAVVAVMATGCVAIPTDSSPQPLKSFERQPAAQPLPKPDSATDPESLVHGFLQATADPTAAHSAARAYLTQANGARWDDRGDTAVLSNINVLVDSRTDDEATVRVIGDNTASLKVNGQLLPATGRVEARLRLAHTPTGWRIDGPLPAGVLLDRAQFESTYRLVTLYFTDRDHQRLVGDPRWFYVGQTGPSSVMARLLAGPSLDLVRATASSIPLKTELGEVAPRDEGGVRVDLKGTTSPSEAERTLIAAQTVWTLSSADAPAPYAITWNGAPLLPQHPDGIRVSDVQRFSPTGVSGEEDRLDVISRGELFNVADGQLKPVAGNLNDGKQVESASLSSDRARIAAVRTARPAQPAQQASPPAPGAPSTPTSAPPGPSGPARATLVTGLYGGAVQPLSAGTSITRPSFGMKNDVWAVVDGKPTRWTAAEGAMRTSVADTAALTELAHGPISELQVSPDGVRVAVIVAGQVLFAVIEERPDGQLALAHPRFAAYNIGNRAVALDWASQTTLVVARDATEAPVTQVPLSGLPAAGLVSGNLAPPVHAVAANLSSTYVADTRGVLVLSSSTGNRDQTWVDVPAAKGAGLIPVLP